MKYLSDDEIQIELWKVQNSFENRENSVYQSKVNKNFSVLTWQELGGEDKMVDSLLISLEIQWKQLTDHTRQQCQCLTEEFHENEENEEKFNERLIRIIENIGLEKVLDKCRFEGMDE